jgi:diketogulonate reductase-like aldo/keto reductase
METDGSTCWRFNTDVIDLMQMANLTDWKNQLPILREWKQEGRFRYIGVTVFRPEQHETLETVMLADGVSLWSLR